MWDEDSVYRGEDHGQVGDRVVELRHEPWHLQHDTDYQVVGVTWQDSPLSLQHYSRQFVRSSAGTAVVLFIKNELTELVYFPSSDQEVSSITDEWEENGKQQYVTHYVNM